MPISRISPFKRTPRSAGFTLVELMIVVAIVGILAVVALFGYRAIIASSKTAEPRQVLQSIRLQQEAYKAETGSYADIGDATALCPSNGMTGKKWGWDPACAGTKGTWGLLTVNPDGPVMFGYATEAGVFGGTFTASPTVSGIAIPANAPAGTTGAGYWAYAKGDPGAGTVEMLTCSLSKEIFTKEP